MIRSEFVAWSFVSGVRKDLDRSLIELGSEIVQVRNQLEELEAEQTLLRLLVDYTLMLEKGAGDERGKCLEIVKRALQSDETMEELSVIRKKVDIWKKKCQEELAGRPTETPKIIDPREEPEPEPQQEPEPEPEIESKFEFEDIVDVNSQLIEWARTNKYKSIEELCASNKYKLEELAYFAAYEEALSANSKLAQAVLWRWFGDLITEDKDQVDYEYSSDIPSPLIFSESQVKEAIFEAARIWGKSSKDSGKFSLRVFIEILEDKLGNEVDIDTDWAEHILRNCSSASHYSGDVWMEVN